ncbi:hypothetical protein Tco_1330734, partial [Tanacetum coccineum]
GLNNLIPPIRDPISNISLWVTPSAGLAAAAAELSPTSSVVGGGASGLVGESIKGGGNGREWEVRVVIVVVMEMVSGVAVGKESGGEDIASSLETSELDHAGTGTGSGIVILAVIRYVG